MGEEKGSGNLSGTYPLRVEDLVRHLDDLRLQTYEGAASRPDREILFKRAVELVSPIVSRVLEYTNAQFLEHTGDIRFEPPADDGAEGLVARWSLSWPAQRESLLASGKGPLEPIQVIARFHAGFVHGHLAGSQIGYWPLQVTAARDAERQEPIIRAIVEAELHQRVFDTEGNWRIVPSYARSR